MAYRAGGITGSNNIPLGARRRFGDGDNGSTEDERRQPQYAPQPSVDYGSKRGRSPTRRKCSYMRPRFRSFNGLF